MSPAPSPGVELIVDRCIDRLLNGRSWDDILPDDDAAHEEIAALMRVARILQQISGDAPKMTAERLRRIWERTGAMLKAMLAPTAPLSLLDAT